MCVVLFYLSKTKKKAFVLFYLHLYHIPTHVHTEMPIHTYSYIHVHVFIVFYYIQTCYIYIYKCVRVCVFGNVTLQRIQEEKLENSPAFPCVLCLA